MSSATKPVEQKARELLAAECEACGANASAKAIRMGQGEDFFVGKQAALRAIIAALNTDEER